MPIDLNCDVGEGSRHDEALAAVVSSFNVACGFHAGGPALMRRTVELAAVHRVALGAHPGLADPEGMGRRDVAATPDEIYEMVLYQIGALRAFAQRSELRLQHVKPHGALYHRAARDRDTADAIATAVADHGGHLLMVGLAGSEHERSAIRARVPFAAEAFADRTYQADGTLTPRDRPDAFVTDPAAAAARVVRMIGEGRVQATSGEWLPIRPQTLCVHGDGPHAVEIATAVRRALEGANVPVASLRDWL